jgi:hypothetical protein
VAVLRQGHDAAEEAGVGRRRAHRPGGSTIRQGAFVAKSVVCMPPMYVNIGAYIDEGALSIRTRWSGRARRSASACTSAPRRRSAA